MLPRLWTLTAILLGSCEEAREPEVLRGVAMGTTYEIKFMPSDTAQPEGVVGARITDELARFDAVFSTYDSDSEISRFNRHGVDGSFAASVEFCDVVIRALDVAEKTGGAFDPTVGPLLELYGFGPGADEDPDLPTEQMIREAKQRIGWRKIRVNASGSLLRVEQDVELDLNAIAKGTGVDRISGLLDSLGCESYMVEIGGEVRCRGLKPDGSDWTIGIRGSSEQGGFLARVPLRNRAMATSGSHFQFRDTDVGRVHHIIDPRSGSNFQSRVDSVTVVADTCELADALATALMVLGPQESEGVLARFAADDVRVLFSMSGPGAPRTVGHRWDFR